MTGYRFDEHTQSIIERSVVPIWIYQVVDGHIVTVAASEGFCRLFGYKDLTEAAEAMDGDSYRNVHPDDVMRAAKAASEFDREDKPYDQAYRIMTECGYRTVRACGRHIAADTGERLAAVWFIDEGAAAPDADIDTPKAERERESADRLSVLSDNYLSVYTVDVATGCFAAYEMSGFFKDLGAPIGGDDFFTSTRNISLKYVCPDDMDKFMTVFTRENVMRVIGENGMFTLEYRVIINAEPLYICLKAAMSKDSADEMIVGFVNIDAQKKREIQYESNQSAAWEKANKDALTGVKSKHSFDVYKEKLQQTIEQEEKPEVAIGVFDCDNLKKINDQYGHDKGNLYLMASCRLICKVFKHSPVFRLGGDEFAVILSSDDYYNIDELLQEFLVKQSKIVSSAKKPWEKVSVSFGIAVYCPQIDYSINDLIRRADQLMYDNKHTRRENLNKSPDQG